MDIMDEDMLRFWEALNLNGVEYMMVGGVAVNLHGYARTTDDIDIWIKDTIENRRKLGLALEKFGYVKLNLENFQFLPGWSNFNIGSGIELDIMTSMKSLEGFTFNECINLASIAEIRQLKVPFIHINHLIQNKKAVNRPKDQIDVIELEKILEIHKETGLIP